MSTDRLSNRLAKIEAVSKPKSFVLYVDDDGIPLPGQNVGAHYVEAPARSLSAEEWMARYAPRLPAMNSLRRRVSAQSRVVVRIIPTDEEAMIAQHTLDTIRALHPVGVPSANGYCAPLRGSTR